MNTEEAKYWLDLSYKISTNVEDAVKQAQEDPEVNTITKMGADGTPTHKIDEYAENAAIKTIEKSGKSLILISEEIGTIKIGNDTAEAIIVMDPLDGTTNALKKIPCYGISIAVATATPEEDVDKLTLDDIEIAYVKNFPTGDVYTAVKGHGALKNDQKIQVSNITEMSSTTICTYIYRAKIEQIADLCKAVRRIRIIGSIAVELCYVADGTYESFIDARKIVRILDIAAAQLIIKENGGIVTNHENKKLTNKLSLKEKTSIIASSNQIIHDNVRDLLK